MSKQKYPQTTSVSTSTSGESRSLHRGRGSYSQWKTNAKRNRKREEAEDRQSKYNMLTIAEKFTTLIKDGSKRQRNKLEKQLAEAVAKGIPATPPVEKSKSVKNPKSKKV